MRMESRNSCFLLLRPFLHLSGIIKKTDVFCDWASIKSDFINIFAYVWQSLVNV